MVRETRYLLVGNLPETTTEDEITEYFKRFGKIQKVKLDRKPEGSDQEEKEEGCITGLTATVAFTDIKSASTAHKAEKTINNSVLTSEYSSGFGATGKVVQRTHEPEIFPRAPLTGHFPNRKSFEEEADGFDVYYGTTAQYCEPSYASPTFADRSRPRERRPPLGGPFQNRGGKWVGGATRSFTESANKDGFEKTKFTSTIPQSPAPSQTSSKRRKKKKKSKSVERSGSTSSSNSSRSSSSCSDAASASSKEQPKSTVAAIAELKDLEIEPGEREPLGILITKLPLRSSDTSLRDGLFHEYKKYGKITAVQITGVAETRSAIISFKQSEDAAKALEASRDKRFFGTAIHVVQHEGLEVEDCGGGEFLTPEAQLDEHSPKATRTLFLGNLDKEITIEEIKEKLEKYGEILDVDVKRQGAVTAYSFIQFTDITSVVKALKDLDGISWGATKLKVGFGKSMATPVVWLGNLADSVHEGFLCRQFARFGMLSHAVVDKETHKGLVFFMAVESAQYALPEMRNRVWNGKKIHIDYASRDCQEAFFNKMEQSGQLHSGERPDVRWMEKRIASQPHWDDGMDPNFKRGGFNQFARGRGRPFQRGRGFFRCVGGSFEGTYTPISEEFGVPHRKQFEEFSQGSGVDEDSYEEELREYGHSQWERQTNPSPPPAPPSYEDAYFDRGSKSGPDYDLYDKHRLESYHSPASDHDTDIVDDDFKYKTRVPNDERYYYNKDKLAEEVNPHDSSHSSDSKHYRLPSEVAWRQSRSRSPTRRPKGTKELPISYRSPTPTDEEPGYHSDNSPTDFESAYRKYGVYKKGTNSDGDKKSGVLSTGLRKEIEFKTDEHSSHKRSYEQMSPKHSGSVQRLERQVSKGSRAESLYEFEKGEKLSAKELISKVARLRSELNERLGKSSPTSGSNSDLDPSTITEAELIKLHREKQKLLQQLTMMDDAGNNSDDDNRDSKHCDAKKARLDLKHIQKSENLTKQELKVKLKMLDETSSYHKQMESLRKKELRDLKKSKSVSEKKKDYMDYSEDDSYSLTSSRDHSPGFIPQKKRKVERENERKSRSYSVKHDEGHHAYSSEEGKEKSDSLQRQISTHVDFFLSKSQTQSSLDARLESDLFSVHTKDDSRRISSGSDNNREQSEHGNSRKGKHKHKKDNHITPLIPLGDDDMPDPETSDPRVERAMCELPLVLPLPDFAQFIQFSPLPSPHHSPERYSNDLQLEKLKENLPHTAPVTGSADQSYQSPCFSPQSSSSKTHSPSQSPSVSGSDTKPNTNSDSGSADVLLEFPAESEQIDSDENKTGGLDSITGSTKLQECKDDDSFSDNNSDIDNLNSENLSIDERIRQLDEKWNKAQSVGVVTPKIIPDVDSVVNSGISSSMLAPLVSNPMIPSLASPVVSSLYSKYRIRKKNDPSVSEKLEPSEIVQTVLSKSSIFDQDSKRLGQISDSIMDNKESMCVNESSPKSGIVWNKQDPKENTLVTVPGSLLDRLGQGSSGSFPTLTVNTIFPSTANLSVNKTDMLGIENRAVSRLSTSPGLESSHDTLHVSQNLGFIEKSPLRMGCGHENTWIPGIAGTDISVTNSNVSVIDIKKNDTPDLRKIPVFEKNIMPFSSKSEKDLICDVLRFEINNAVSDSRHQIQSLIKHVDNENILETGGRVGTSDSYFELENVKADVLCKEKNDSKVGTIELLNELGDEAVLKSVTSSASADKIKIEQENIIDKSALEMLVNPVSEKESIVCKNESADLTDKAVSCFSTTAKQLHTNDGQASNDAGTEYLTQFEKPFKGDLEIKMETVSSGQALIDTAFVDKLKEQDKCTGQEIFNKKRNDSSVEHSNKRSKLSKEVEKRSSSSHSDKHKKSGKKSDSVKRSGSDNKDKKEKSKSHSDKDKIESNKKLKDVKKNNDEKKKKSEKKEKKEPLNKDSKEEKKEPLDKDSKEEKKEPLNKDNKEEKKEPLNKDSKEEKKEPLNKDSKEEKKEPLNKDSKEEKKEPLNKDSKQAKKEPLNKDSKEEKKEPLNKDSKEEKKEPLNKDSKEEKKEPLNKDSKEEKKEPLNKDSKDEKKEPLNKDSKEEKKEPLNKDSKEEKKEPLNKDSKESKKEPLNKDSKEEKNEKLENSRCVKNEEKKEKGNDRDKVKQENDDKKEKRFEKKEKVKADKDKADKKESHRHEKHSTKDKKSKSLKGQNLVSKDKIDGISKDKSSIETISKEESDQIKSDQGKSDKAGDQSNKKEHKSSQSSSHKAKYDKDGSKIKKCRDKEEIKSVASTKKSKSSDSKKIKDDHSEHKKKEETNNRNNKDSPDKSTDVSRKETISDKKSVDKVSAGEKCKEERTKHKEKENKDKDPDSSKSKRQSSSALDSDRPLSQSIDVKVEKSKTETEKDSSKTDSKKEDKKSNDAEETKNANLSLQATSNEKDSLVKSLPKNHKISKAISNDKNFYSSKSREIESRGKKKTHQKKEQHVSNGLTEEDLAIFAQFSEEPYMSMYDKVKRRSTEKKLHCEKELEEQKKLFTEFKRKNKHLTLSDVTESSEMSSDDERKKKNGNSSESSMDTAILNKKSKSKTQTKKPKRILDVYSSDSEEEEMLHMKMPAKKSSYKKKTAEVPSENENKFEFDSCSDSDNKSSATKQAKSRFSSKTKNQTKENADTCEANSQMANKLTKPKIPGKDPSLKSMFSDESDENMNFDSDSCSGFVISSDVRQKSLSQKDERSKNKLPRGSSIYTSSDDSDGDVFKPMSPHKITLTKKSEKKELNSQIHAVDVKIQSKKKNHNNRNVACVEDKFVSGLEIKLAKENIKQKETLSDLEMVKDRTQNSFDNVDKITNNEKFNAMITNGDQIIQALSKMEIEKPFPETVYEKETFSNLTKKDKLLNNISENIKDFKFDRDSFKNGMPSLIDKNSDGKLIKANNKKHKKENQHKNNKNDRIVKDSVKEKNELSKKFLECENLGAVQQSVDIPKTPVYDSDLENECLNAVNRNLFDEIKVIKSPGPVTENDKIEINDDMMTKLNPEIPNYDVCFHSDKWQVVMPEISDKVHETSDIEKHVSTNVFDFMNDEHGTKSLKESNMKIAKMDTYEKVQNEEKYADIAFVPDEVQGLEIVCRSEEHDYRDEGTCPLEVTEVVIGESSIDEKMQNEKPKLMKNEECKNMLKDYRDIQTDLTQDAISSLDKEHLPKGDVHLEDVHFEAPLSNEQELVIDEGVSLHVEADSGKADESLVNDENDETSKAVESLLLDEISKYSVSESVEHTEQLDQNVLQPDFALNLPTNVPQVGTNIETTSSLMPLKEKISNRGKRAYSNQSDVTLNKSSCKLNESVDQHYSTLELSSKLDQNDDYDFGRLQIDFDPPKPEPKQKKQRKSKQQKLNIMNDAQILAAENNLNNLFRNFSHADNEGQGHIRDSLSSENSELERSKHEELLFMDREDQRHDADMMSHDEKSTSDDLLSPSETSKVKSRRGRKPRRTATISKTNSPRSMRTLSPRSPRNFEPRSPKTEVESKLNDPKELTIEVAVDSKAVNLGSNVFDFDENDDSGLQLNQTTSPVKQRNLKGKKNDLLQSPENKSVFSSPEHKFDDRLIPGISDSKNYFNQEHHSESNFAGKKGPLCSKLSPVGLKVEVHSVSDNKPPEPLFKAFFEAKSKIENDKVNPLLDRKTVGTLKDCEAKILNSHSMSSIDKTIEDVSKGFFEIKEEELKNLSLEEIAAQKRRQSKKIKDDELKSPIKSPKSAVISRLNSLAPELKPTLFQPGMEIEQPSGQTHQIGEPQLAGHVGMLVHLSMPNKISSPLDVKSSQENSLTITPEAGKLIEQQPAVTTNIQFPVKLPGPSTVQISATSSVGSSVSAAHELGKVDSCTELFLKSGFQGLLVNNSSASVNNIQEKASSLATGQPTVAPIADALIKHHVGDKPMLDKQFLEQKNVEQKLTEIQLQKQQEHPVLLKEQELIKQKQQEHPVLLKEQELIKQKQQEHPVLLKEQELIKQKQQEHLVLLKEQELIKQKQQEHPVLLKEQESMKQLELQKQLEHQHKQLQEHLKSREEILKKEQLHELLQKKEQLQRQQVLQTASVPSGVLSGQLLLPGQRPRPSLPSPGNGKSAPRPLVSAHHQMPPGAFAVTQHSGIFQGRPSLMPSHLPSPQMQAMHIVQPLVQDKTPTDAELAQKHQQLQLQIAAHQAQVFAEQQAQQTHMKPNITAKGNARKVTSKGNKKAAESKHPNQSSSILPIQSKDAPLPGSQEAANQLTQQIKQQLAMQQQAQQLSLQGTQPLQTPHLNWHLHSRPEAPRQPNQGPLSSEMRTSMPGPVPVLGGNAQQVQRVSPHPLTKSPTVAQTAPNMTLGFAQLQTAASQAPSPVLPKTAEWQQSSSGVKWPGTNPPNQTQPDIKPRVASADVAPPSTRPEYFATLTTPTSQASLNLNPVPRPAHQQPPSAHHHQPEHALIRPPASLADRMNKEKLFQQQQQMHQVDLQQQELILHQFRDQALHEQAQKEAQLHKERERVESLDRQKRDALAGLSTQSVSDARQSPAVRMGYSFVEPRPQSRDGKAVIVDPRFAQQFPGHHPADLRLGTSQASAFSPGNGHDAALIYTQGELQRLQQNGLMSSYPTGLLLREPHLMSSHGSYIIPSVQQHLAFIAQQMEHPHLGDGRPPSCGTSRPPSNQTNAVSPTQQQTPNDVYAQNLVQTIGPPPIRESVPRLFTMHFISGFRPLVEMSLPQKAPDGSVPPLRIAQRMRLEQTQLDGVSKRMQMEKDYCMMLAMPSGRDKISLINQTHFMSTGFIQYLQQKQAAGIVNVADPGSQQPAYVVHIFPPCDFSQNMLSRLGTDLLYEVKDLVHLVVIIATVA